MRRKIRKFQGGGMDASKSDFKSPSSKGSDHSHSRFETGSGYYGETPTNTGGGKGTTITNNPPVKTKKNLGVNVNPVTTVLNVAGSVVGNIPFLGYGVDQLNKFSKYTKQQTAKGETLFGNPKKGNKGMPLTRDFYRTENKPLDVTSAEGKSYMKDAGFLKGPPQNTGGGDGIGETKKGLCPDGTNPPCKTPITQIKQPVSKPNPFLAGFKAYDDGGEVVISSNVDKDLL
jgi:hypothetical protein